MHSSIDLGEKGKKNNISGNRGPHGFRCSILWFTSVFLPLFSMLFELFRNMSSKFGWFCEWHFLGFFFKANPKQPNTVIFPLILISSRSVASVFSIILHWMQLLSSGNILTCARKKLALQNWLLSMLPGCLNSMFLLSNVSGLVLI